MSPSGSLALTWTIHQELKEISPISDDTVECCYNTVKFVTILHSALWWQWQNISHTLDSIKTPHTSPSWASYGTSFVRTLEKIDCVITALHCMYSTCPKISSCFQRGSNKEIVDCSSRLHLVSVDCPGSRWKSCSWKMSCTFAACSMRLWNSHRCTSRRLLTRSTSKCRRRSPCPSTRVSWTMAKWVWDYWQYFYWLL